MKAVGQPHLKGARHYIGEHTPTVSIFKTDLPEDTRNTLRDLAVPAVPRRPAAAGLFRRPAAAGVLRRPSAALVRRHSATHNNDLFSLIDFEASVTCPCQTVCRVLATMTCAA